MWLVALLLIIFPLVADEWVDLVSSRIDLDAVSWVKQQLKKDLEKLKEAKATQEGSELFGTKKCLTASNNLKSDPDITLYVFMSFSVPDEVWIGLSNELEKVDGVFVIRGIPNESFKELSSKVQKLSALGVSVPIHIHPLLFKEYEIDTVPTFLVKEEGQFDKVSGNISLAYALQQMIAAGETVITKQLEKKLRREK